MRYSYRSFFVHFGIFCLFWATLPHSSGSCLSFLKTDPKQAHLFLGEKFKHLFEVAKDPLAEDYPEKRARIEAEIANYLVLQLQLRGVKATVSMTFNEAYRHYGALVKHRRYLFEERERTQEFIDQHGRIPELEWPIELKQAHDLIDGLDQKLRQLDSNKTRRHMEVIISEHGIPFLEQVRKKYNVKDFVIDISARADHPQGLGSFSTGTRRISFSPEEALELPKPNSILLHEVHHASNDFRMRAGEDRKFQARARALSGHSITSNPMYASFVSFDEISAYRKTLQWTVSGNGAPAIYTDHGAVFLNLNDQIRARAAILYTMSRDLAKIVDLAAFIWEEKQHQGIQIFFPSNDPQDPPTVTFPLYREGEKIGTFELLLLNFKAGEISLDQAINNKLKSLASETLKHMAYARQVIRSLETKD